MENTETEKQSEHGCPETKTETDYVANFTAWSDAAWELFDATGDGL